MSRSRRDPAAVFGEAVPLLSSDTRNCPPSTAPHSPTERFEVISIAPRS
jgi:hypothetical protein